MAYAGKSAQREALSTNYKGGVSTLQSKDVTMAKSEANGPSKLWGSMGGKSSGNDGLKGGRMVSRSTTSGLAGKMSDAGYTSGPQWKRAMEPGELQPGKASQKNNTTRMAPGEGKKPAVMKTTGTTPKALRGGR